MKRQQRKIGGRSRRHLRVYFSEVRLEMTYGLKMITPTSISDKSLGWFDHTGPVSVVSRDIKKTTLKDCVGLRHSLGNSHCVWEWIPSNSFKYTGRAFSLTYIQT